MSQARETSGKKVVLALLAAVTVVGGALWLGIKAMTPETLPEGAEPAAAGAPGEAAAAPPGGDGGTRLLPGGRSSGRRDERP